MSRRVRGRRGVAPGAATTRISSANGRTASIAWSSSGRPSIGSASLSRPNRLDRPPARTIAVTRSRGHGGLPATIPAAALGPGRWPSGVRRRTPRRSRSARIAITYLRLVPVASRRAAGRQRSASGGVEGRSRDLAIGRGGVGEVGLEDDDPALALELADPVGRAAGAARGLGQRRRGGDRQRAFEPVHRGAEARIVRPGRAAGSRVGGRCAPSRTRRPSPTRRSSRAAAASPATPSLDRRLAPERASRDGASRGQLDRRIDGGEEIGARPTASTSGAQADRSRAGTA